MAFDFLGTMSQNELSTLRIFLQGEIEDAEEHINTLRVELDNVTKTRNDLITADQQMGGDTINDMGEDEIAKDIKRHYDITSAELMYKIKEPFIPNIKYKRERIEYKIKKLTDTMEQLKKQIDIKSITITETEELLAELNSKFSNENADHLFRTEQEQRDAELGLVNIA